VASAHRRSIIVVLLLVSVLIGAAGLPLSSATADGRSAADRSFQSGTGPANNTTVPHENPAAVDDEGNVSELQGWLSDRLSETLIDCTEGLEVGEYDACNQTEDYPDWLDKYVNVTRDSESDTNKTTAFKRTSENQSEYASDVQRFRNTVEQYRDARQKGDTQRAQRLARRAQRIARQVNETGDQLTRGYRTIGIGSSQNFTAVTNTTRTITQNVTSIAESVSVEQFKNTTITATAASRQISFDGPLRVTGRLTTSNGTPLADRTIALQAGDQIRRTTTNESGRYAITYRPVLLSLDTRRVSVRYRPTTQSVYRSNRTSLPITVQQVQPTVQATAEPQRVSFGDLLSVTGRVAVNDTAVRSMPVMVSIDGRELRFASGGRARTTDSGQFRTARELPAGIAAGRQTVRVSLPVQNRALGGANVSVPVTVTSTATTLSINASQQSINSSAVDGPVVSIEGRLTANGTPLRNRSVAISLSNSTTDVTTNSTGDYSANITVPKNVFAGETGSVATTITVVYDGTGTNLKSSRRRTSIQLAVPAQTTGILERFLTAFGALPWTNQLLIGLGLLFVGGYTASRFRVWAGLGGSDDSTTEQTTADSGDFSASQNNGQPSLLETARNQLSRGESASAVGLAYTAVRQRLQNDLDLASAHTHWEFFEAYTDRDIGDDRLNAVQRLTELYERATFSQRSLSPEMATTALENAETVADRNEQTSSEEPTSEIDPETDS